MPFFLKQSLFKKKNKTGLFFEKLKAMLVMEGPMVNMGT